MKRNNAFVLDHLRKIVFVFCLFPLFASGERVVPVPNPAQTQWQDAELAVLISYDLHVFDGKAYEQTANRITPIEDYNIFCPKQLNTDQWIRSVRAMGGKIAILTVTHETGFALYQSDVNPYCMKALKWKNGKGDIVRDFVKSCRKYGVLPGLYIGIRWNSFLGVHDFKMPQDSTAFERNRQTYYNHMCEKMTGELMSRYGPLAIVWYDGGSYGPELGGPDVLPVVNRYQHKIIFYHNTRKADIRWGGSETGTVPYPCWGNYPFPFSHAGNPSRITGDKNALLKTGDPDGPYYVPAMADVPLRSYNGRHEWFWEPNDESHILPLKDLLSIYDRSVGHNATLILGLTPDDRGLMPEADVKRLKEFGDAIRLRFAHPLQQTSGTGRSFELTFRGPSAVREVVIMEDLQHGELVRSFQIDGFSDGQWVQIAEGSCIGHKVILPVRAGTYEKLRLSIRKAVNDAAFIRSFTSY